MRILQAAELAAIETGKQSTLGGFFIVANDPLTPMSEEMAKVQRVIRHIMSLHEAGHAVAIYLFGFRLGMTTVPAPPLQYDASTGTQQWIAKARCEYLDPLCDERLLSKGPEGSVYARKETVRKDIVAFLAGRAAERHFGYGAWHYAASRDTGMPDDFLARERVQLLTTSEQEANALLHVLAARAQRLVAREEFAIVDLAEALFTSTTVSASDARAIIRTARSARRKGTRWLLPDFAYLVPGN